MFPPLDRRCAREAEEEVTITTLVKQPLFPEFETMERRFRRLFEGTSLMPTFTYSPVPPADVYETPEQYVVELEVPGYEEQELDVEISDHTLSVSGAREEKSEGKDKSYQLHERLERTFRRTFALPAEVDAERATAAFETGVLKVRAPKVAITQPRKIAISKP
jgi:HSP20 family protein